MKRLPDWDYSSHYVGVPDYATEVFTHKSGRVEIVISPYNERDDGVTPVKYFYVAVYEFVTYDEDNDEWIDDSLLVGKRVKSHPEALRWALHFSTNLLDLIDLQEGVPA